MIRKKRIDECVFYIKPNLLKKATNSACMLYVAKNVRITDNKSKSIVFCVFVTVKYASITRTMLFSGTISSSEIIID